MTRLRTTVQSFDLFDTLIARACITPANLFAEMEANWNLSGFAQQRMAAEQRLAATGQPFGLDTIYAALRDSGFCDAATAQRLRKAEIEAEFDNAIPIAHNMAAVRDHDLVVSDMYLPAPILRGLLQHAGLRRHVHLFASNAGKHSGSIWPQLTDQWLLLHHTGDHAHSDVAMPQRWGIATRHYTGAALSPTEQFLQSKGLGHTARLIRQLRLANPFQPPSVEAELWEHFAQFNVPLLLLATQAVRHQRDALGLARILFLGRDCHFLSELFLTLHPEEPFELLQVSRNALAQAPALFARYLQSSGQADGLVCDLVSTGYSWLQHTQSTAEPLAFFTLVYIDNYQYQPFDTARLLHHELLRFGFAVRSSEVNTWSLAIELLNTAPHGSTVGIAAVADTFVPTFESRHELPRSFLTTLQLAQAATVQCLRPRRAHIAQELAAIADLPPLISAMVSALSGADWLNRFASTAICQPRT